MWSFRSSHFLLCLLTASTYCGAWAQQTPNAPADLAQGKSFVSSDPNQSQWNSGLTDGAWSEGKGTTFATGREATFPKSVTVDLEVPTSVGYVGIGVPNFGSTKTVDVSTSEDGTTFTEVGTYAFSLRKAENHLFSFPAVTARYVRLTYADHYDENVSYPNTHAFTTELAVYAPGASPTLPVPRGPERPDVAAPKYGTGDQIQARFEAMHQSFLQRGKDGPIGVLFLGDSITERWANAKDIWEKNYGAYQPANFGIGGDRTQHVLWRIDNGELDGINPKVVVLMIGTNNIASSADEIAKADTKIVEEIHQKLPQTKVLLLGVFPRGASATDPARAKIKNVNAQLAKLDDGNKTRFLDFGDKFLDTNGDITKEIMPDALHPSPAGYQIWADAMQPTLDEMMK